jgi:ribosomal protein L16/L10AE
LVFQKERICKRNERKLKIDAKRTGKGEGKSVKWLALFKNGTKFCLKKLKKSVLKHHTKNDNAAF